MLSSRSCLNRKKYTLVSQHRLLQFEHLIWRRICMYQGYSEWQDFSPFPLLETCSFFLIWYFMIKKAMLVVGLIKKDSNIILICPKPNYHFFWLCNTKLEKKNVFLTMERGEILPFKISLVLISILNYLNFLISMVWWDTLLVNIEPKSVSLIRECALYLNQPLT